MGRRESFFQREENASFGLKAEGETPGHHKKEKSQPETMIPQRADGKIISRQENQESGHQHPVAHGFSGCGPDIDSIPEVSHRAGQRQENHPPEKRLGGLNNGCLIGEKMKKRAAEKPIEEGKEGPPAPSPDEQPHYSQTKEPGLTGADETSDQAFRSKSKTVHRVGHERNILKEYLIGGQDEGAETG